MSRLVRLLVEVAKLNLTRFAEIAYNDGKLFLEETVVVQSLLIPWR